MMSMDYAISKTVNTNFQDTIRRLTSELKNEGFDNVLVSQ